jgi:hypothetical protein
MNLGGEKKIVDKENGILSTERTLNEGWQQKNVATVIGKKSTVTKDFGTQKVTTISKRLKTQKEDSVTMRTKKSFRLRNKMF